MVGIFADVNQGKNTGMGRPVGPPGNLAGKTLDVPPTGILKYLNAATGAVSFVGALATAPSIGDAYTIEAEIGTGGMGTVYLARDTAHGRTVALKVLHRDPASDYGVRFRREVEVQGNDYVIYYTETGRAGGAYLDEDVTGDGIEDFVPLNDPRVFGDPRNVRVGVSFSF